LIILHPGAIWFRPGMTKRGRRVVVDQLATDAVYCFRLR